MPAPPSRIVASWLFGADPSCDVVVNDVTVSTRHCRLTQHDQGFTLEDLGSTNGTFVENVRLSPRRPTAVTPEQRITLGPSTPLPSRPAVGDRG